MRHINRRAKSDLASVSFRASDHKPHHFILRRQKNGLLPRGAPQAGALVDIEMLEFRPEMV